MWECPGSAALFVPPHEQPGAASAEAPGSLCSGGSADRTKPTKLVQSGAGDKGGLIPTTAGKNGHNYLIIPAASTAPRERVTGVQQCLCCT